MGIGINNEEILNWGMRYANEVVEAFIAFTVFMLISGSTLNFDLFYKNLKISLVIGLFTLGIEYYNPLYTTSIKHGALTVITGKLLKNNIV